MPFYVYKYEDNGIPIYIGQTIRLLTRISEHKKDDWYKPRYKIYYTTCNTKTEMDGLEYFLIKKYRPIYNKRDNNENSSPIRITDPPWVEYSSVKKEPNKNKPKIANKPEKKRINIKSGTYTKEELILLTGKKDLSNIKRDLTKQGYKIKTNGRRGSDYRITISNA